MEGLKQLASNERDNINSTKHLFGAAKSNFSTDVRELISRIRRVLSSTQQMKIFEDDPEMFVELQHVMAQVGFNISHLLSHWFMRIEHSDWMI